LGMGVEVLTNGFSVYFCIDGEGMNSPCLRVPLCVLTYYRAYEGGIELPRRCAAPPLRGGSLELGVVQLISCLV
jgi:hypothetical protein